MSRLPIPHIINTIKTKLGFDRTMTASGEDVVDAVNKQSQQIDELGPYNGLDSDSTTAALAAAQGKALNQKISILPFINYIEPTFSNGVAEYDMTNLINQYTPNKRLRYVVASFNTTSVSNTIIRGCSISGNSLKIVANLNTLNGVFGVFVIWNVYN